MKVSAKTKKHPEPIAVDYNIPETLKGMIDTFGEPVVTSAAKGAIVISLQSAMRRLMEKGKSQAEIQAEVAKWKPDTRTINRMSAFEKATATLDKLSPEERKQLLAKLQGMKQ